MMNLKHFGSITREFEDVLVTKAGGIAIMN